MTEDEKIDKLIEGLVKEHGKIDLKIAELEKKLEKYGANDDKNYTSWVGRIDKLEKRLNTIPLAPDRSAHERIDKLEKILLPDSASEYPIYTYALQLQMELEELKEQVKIEAINMNVGQVAESNAEQIIELKEQIERNINILTANSLIMSVNKGFLKKQKEVLREIRLGIISILQDAKAHQGLRLHESIFLETLLKLDGDKSGSGEMEDNRPVSLRTSGLTESQPLSEKEQKQIKELKEEVKEIETLSVNNYDNHKDMRSEFRTGIKELKKQIAEHKKTETNLIKNYRNIAGIYLKKNRNLEEVLRKLIDNLQAYWDLRVGKVHMALILKHLLDKLDGEKSVASLDGNRESKKNPLSDSQPSIKQYTIKLFDPERFVRIYTKDKIPFGQYQIVNLEKYQDKKPSEQDSPERIKQIKAMDRMMMMDLGMKEEQDLTHKEWKKQKYHKLEKEVAELKCVEDWEMIWYRNVAYNPDHFKIVEKEDLQWLLKQSTMFLFDNSEINRLREKYLAEE